MANLWAQFQAEFYTIITDGGYLMIPLTILAVGIYYSAFKLIFFFSEHPFYRTKRDQIISVVTNPGKVDGELRSILDYTQNQEIERIDDIKQRFDEIVGAYLSEVDGKRGYLLTLITTAPLMGLLGTVMGMLTTFGGLAVSVGGSTVDQIAAGISEALITTQTGLIIAIPAYVMMTLIQKRRNEMESFLTSMETVTVQLFQKRTTSKEVK